MKMSKLLSDTRCHPPVLNIYQHTLSHAKVQTKFHHNVIIMNIIIMLSSTRCHQTILNMSHHHSHTNSHKRTFKICKLTVFKHWVLSNSTLYVSSAQTNGLVQQTVLFFLNYVNKLFSNTLCFPTVCYTTQN